YLVAPPELARNAPGLDVPQPFEIDLGIAGGLEGGVALFHRLDGRLGQDLGVHIPLVRKPRLDHHARAVAVGNDVTGLLDFFQPALFLSAGDDGLAGLETVHALIFGGHVGGVGGGDASLRIHDVQGGEPRALAHAEIVEVVGRGDLYRARTLGRIGVVVGD